LAAQYSRADGTTEVLGADSCSPLAEANSDSSTESNHVCADSGPAHDRLRGACGAASSGQAHAASTATLDICCAFEAAKVCFTEHSGSQHSAQGGGNESWSPASEEGRTSDRGTRADQGGH